jgi:hypothetical protein
MSEVTAIVIGRRATTSPPPGDGVAGVLPVPALDAVAGAARSAPTRLVWLLDASALAGAETLAALRRNADAPAVSLPVDAGDQPVDGLVGAFAADDAGRVLDEVARHRVPLRHAPVISLLAERDLVAGLAPARVGRYRCYAGLEWTARLFAGRPGVLVPDSRVRVPGLPRPAVMPAVRLARDGVWGRGDIARELRRAVRGRG